MLILYWFLADTLILTALPLFIADVWYPVRTPRERGQSFWETEVLEKFLEKDWYLNFRMSKEAFKILCDQLRPRVNPQTTNMLEPVPWVFPSVLQAGGWQFFPSSHQEHPRGQHTCPDRTSSAYSLTSNIMKPFPDGTVRGPRAAYNACLSRARIQVEHAFGRLKGRWRCIMKRNDSQTRLNMS